MVAANIDQYATDTDVSTAVSDALVPYYTAAQVDAEIAANGFDASQYWTRTESDSRYFVQTANAGFTSLIRDNVTPPTIRALLPRAPLSTNVLFSDTALELLCDAYSKTEADGRYAQWGNLTSLDTRYFVTTANALHVPGAGQRGAAADQGAAAQGAALDQRALQRHHAGAALRCLQQVRERREVLHKGPVRRRLRAARRAGGAAGQHQSSALWTCESLRWRAAAVCPQTSAAPASRPAAL